MAPSNCGQVGEFEVTGARAGAAEELAGGLVGVDDAEVTADDDARAAQFAQDVGHHLVVGGELVVEPDVADAQADVFQKVEDQLELVVDELFAGDAAIEHGQADDGFAVQDGYGHLGAKQFKFLLRLDVGAGLLAVAADDPAQAEDLSADAGVEGEFKMFEQAGGEADGAGGAEAAAFGPRNVPAEGDVGLAEEGGGAIDAEGLAEKKQELLEQPFRVERVGQDAGIIAQDFEGGRRWRRGRDRRFPRCAR